jgi:hypothetical protein
MTTNLQNNHRKPVETGQIVTLGDEINRLQPDWAGFAARPSADRQQSACQLGAWLTDQVIRTPAGSATILLSEAKRAIHCGSLVWPWAFGPQNIRQIRDNVIMKA